MNENENKYNPKETCKTLGITTIMLYFSPAQMVSAGESIQGTYKGSKK